MADFSARIDPPNDSALTAVRLRQLSGSSLAAQPDVLAVEESA
jgi:hypothetical protein